MLINIIVIAIKLGVDESKILIDDESATTNENLKIGRASCRERV